MTSYPLHIQFYYFLPVGIITNLVKYITVEISIFTKFLHLEISSCLPVIYFPFTGNVVQFSNKGTS